MADEHEEKTENPRGTTTQQIAMPHVSTCQVTVPHCWTRPNDFPWLLVLLDNSDLEQDKGIETELLRERNERSCLDQSQLRF